MSELLALFKGLSEVCTPDLYWEKIEELYEKELSASSNFGLQYQNDIKNNKTPRRLDGITGLQIVIDATEDSYILSILQEICTILRSLRNDAEVGYTEVDNWENITEVINSNAFLSIVYALAGLPLIDPSNLNYVKASISTISTYFLSLTIPGAKAFHIFQEDIISHCLKILTVPERLLTPQVVQRMNCRNESEIWIPFKILLDDMKTLIRFVHFNQYKATRILLIQRIMGIQYMNYNKGFANNYLVDMHDYCYELFDVMVSSTFGDPEATLVDILNCSAVLHTYAPRPKANITTMTSGDYQHISDWFVGNISKHPSLMQKVLQRYIKAIITNPEKSWKTEQMQRVLDYAAKYDAALFKISNDSCVEFLAKACHAKDTSIRSRAVELMCRILQLESSVDWELFRHEVSEIPREIYVLKELIRILGDSNTNIKSKAIQALNMALTKGSPKTLVIVKELAKFTNFNDVIKEIPCEPPMKKNEIRFSKPTPLEPNVTFKGFEIIEKQFAELPKLVYKHIFKNTQAFVRRAGIMLIEELIKLNPLIIFNTAFVEEMVRMVREPTALVRKQLMVTIDSILATYPNCYPVIWAWCKIYARMLYDSDLKNVEVAMSCFYNRVLENITTFDQSTKAEHFMPWVIIRTLLSIENRHNLQHYFHAALQPSQINSNILKTIESHLLTNNSTEAWILLNFLTTKVKNVDTDALLNAFHGIDAYERETNLYIALEVLTNCIESFSHASLNLTFKDLVKRIKDGTLMPTFISNAFNLLLGIDLQNRKSKNQEHAALGDWIRELNNYLEKCLLDGLNLFPDNANQFLSHLYSYTEVNVQIPQEPNPIIINFIFYNLHGYLRRLNDRPDWENTRNINAMITSAGRFSLRDSNVAYRACRIYSSYLNKCELESIVPTIIIALGDICRRQADAFENVLHNILPKLKSSSQKIRIVTFECFESLVLEDLIKLRGSLLLALLCCTLDDCPKLSGMAKRFFTEYLSKKDKKLFCKCLLEYPFILNEYTDFGDVVFSLEGAFNSPLCGPENRKKRQKLYSYLMENADEIFLLTYFDRLKTINQKCKNEENIKNPKGFGMVTDVFYILRLICEQEQIKKKDTNADDDQHDPTFDEVDTTVKGGKVAAETAGAAANGATGAGRGRRRQLGTTMNDAHHIIEKSLVCISQIYESFKSYDESIEKWVDRLCCAIIVRFPKFAEYAQPAAFWANYKKKSTGYATRLKKKGPKRKRVASESSEDDDVPLSSIKKKTFVVVNGNVNVNVNVSVDMSQDVNVDVRVKVNPNSLTGATADISVNQGPTEHFSVNSNTNSHNNTNSHSNTNLQNNSNTQLNMNSNATSSSSGCSSSHSDSNADSNSNGNPDSHVSASLRTNSDSQGLSDSNGNSNILSPRQNGKLSLNVNTNPINDPNLSPYERAKLSLANPAIDINLTDYNNEVQDPCCSKSLKNSPYFSKKSLETGLN